MSRKRQHQAGSALKYSTQEERLLSIEDPTESVYKAQTLQEWCIAHGETYTLVADGGAEVGRLFTGEKTYISVFSPPLFFGRLSDTVILPESTFSCTADHKLVYQGLTHRDYAPSEDLGPFLVKNLGDDQYQLRIPDDMPVVEQECVFLGGRNNFGHFLNEGLMRWSVGKLIPYSDTLPVVIFRGLPRRFCEFLDLLDIPEERRILIDPGVPTRFKRVWRVSSPLYMGHSTAGTVPNWRPECVRYFHDQIRSRALVQDSPPEATDRPILYLVRGSAGWRRVLNEAEVIDCVQRYGGRPVAVDSLSAKEQVQLVGNARVLVSHAGAAPAISLFAPSDCVAVECLPPTVSNLFGPIAYAGCLGQPYHRVLCRISTPEEVLAAGLSIDSSRIFPRDSDYFIDCAALESILRSLPPG